MNFTERAFLPLAIVFFCAVLVTALVDAWIGLTPAQIFGLALLLTLTTSFVVDVIIWKRDLKQGEGSGS